MKISIITATLNNKEIIEECIKSVIGQTYSDVEHIIVDGGSSDGTLDVVNKYLGKVSKVIFQKGKGVFGALNEGVKAATGEVIGFLHADDIYASDKALEKVAEVFNTHGVDSCYADLQYVRKSDTNKIVRYWKAGEYDYNRLKYGWMPPHPAFFVKKEIYERLGYFSTDFAIASDYEIVLRFLYKNRISTYYIPFILLKMRYGGVSNRNLFSMIRKNWEDYRISKMYGLGFFTVFNKNISKASQFFLHD